MIVSWISLMHDVHNRGQSTWVISLGGKISIFSSQPSSSTIQHPITYSQLHQISQPNAFIQTRPPQKAPSCSPRRSYSASFPHRHHHCNIKARHQHGRPRSSSLTRQIPTTCSCSGACSGARLQCQMLHDWQSEPEGQLHSVLQVG